jgi:hypothetical protein
MSRQIVIKAALAATLPIAAVLLQAWSPVGAPSKIAGTFTARYAEQHPLPVADAEGHALLLGRVQGVNRSTGPTRYMDQGMVTSLEFGDLVQGNGSHQGYITFSQGGDTVISKWSGTVTTTLAPDKTPMTSFAGTWTKLKGTGRYEAITGKGTYKGHFISQTEYICDWSGEISGERVAAK